MGTFEFFEHTADLGLRVCADSLEDLFRSAAEGLFEAIVSNPGAVRDAESETVALQGDDPAELLVAWLNELIFRAETRHRLYTRFVVRLDQAGQRLQAEIGGEPIDRDRHILDHEVKAVTHHGRTLRREENDAGWFAELILDI
jgi:SHS2 domain-containing protein